MKKTLIIISLFLNCNNIIAQEVVSNNCSVITVKKVPYKEVLKRRKFIPSEYIQFENSHQEVNYFVFESKNKPLY
jgi:hypothetical protein